MRYNKLRRKDKSFWTIGVWRIGKYLNSLMSIFTHHMIELTPQQVFHSKCDHLFEEN